MIGIDILSVNKIKSLKNRNFFKKIFTSNELDYSKLKSNPYQTLCGIFALKEAMIKAYDLNLSYILKKRIEIRHKQGKPIALIDGKFIDAGLSISHDSDIAIAICVSKEPIITVEKSMKNLLPKRNKNSHKGDYGKISIIGGSKGMVGACYLSSSSALRAGAGLVYLIVPNSISNILQVKCTEQIIDTIDSYELKYNDIILKQIKKKLEDKDVLVIGPGMGREDTLTQLISEVIKVFNGKIIIDADGLNAISEDLTSLKASNDIVLTPHLKEFSRLCGLSIKQINKDRVNIAKRFASKYKVILVLKSENTIVTNGDKLYINKIGNPGMATAGSGDVLTGIIAALLHILDSFQAASLGVYLHSLAADIAVLDIGEDSLIASDIITYLPKAMKLLR